MSIRDLLVPVLVERFSDRGLRLGTRPDPIASFPAKHPEVGDVRVWDQGFGARVAVGEIVEETLHGSPSDNADEATDRIVKSVVRTGPDGFRGTERDVASQLVADYERRNAV
jgi:hypothetical protein